MQMQTCRRRSKKVWAWLRCRWRLSRFQSALVVWRIFVNIVYIHGSFIFFQATKPSLAAPGAFSPAVRFSFELHRSFFFRRLRRPLTRFCPRPTPCCPRAAVATVEGKPRIKCLPSCPRSSCMTFDPRLKGCNFRPTIRRGWSCGKSCR